MIKMTIVRDEADHTIQSFTLSGHADAADYGEDIVCAGVSAVAIGAVNAIESLCVSPLHVESGENGGYLHGAIPDAWSGREAEDGQLLLEGMLVSIYGIQESYGDFIEVTEK
ncbi:ribosomal-processing cysteine protease Prp [Salicibibacter halophilus]|uniref:Ribosomal processing cysteine protease Prp n=1 Tax=Salicibibacter halophilus TaxID=2502791 RepID=A0A514LGP4_9BACI|nr:ribosomal-processing cysteine protease Prp [Salicibibacter halophilus]QDI91023.1 ribosomal-processing cysteine protease Prp [Salicibibacter halophilus]